MSLYVLNNDHTHTIKLQDSLFNFPYITSAKLGASGCDRLPALERVPMSSQTLREKVKQFARSTLYRYPIAILEAILCRTMFGPST